MASATSHSDTPNSADCWHELPDDYKRAVVDASLASLASGGKAIFVDYHRPHWAHPLRGVMSLVFDLLEPFAKKMWSREIAGFATDGRDFTWRKQTSFGGLYQMTVAHRRKPAWTGTSR